MWNAWSPDNFKLNVYAKFPGCSYRASLSRATVGLVVAPTTMWLGINCRLRI